MNITGTRLRNLRQQRGLSQAEVAKYLKISRPAYVKYETGISKPVRKINELCDLFGVTSDYILGTDIPQKATNPPHFSINNDEKELIEIYRKLPDSVKSFVKTTVESYLDKENAKKTAKRDGA